MATRRVLYLTGRQLSAYRVKSGALELDADFAVGEEGAVEFAKYVSAAPNCHYYLLADVVEEDFFQENIPFVRGRDRKALLGRKLAQRYRDTSLALTLSLGYEATERREERILYSSFSNTQQFQPWLAALRANEARVVGVYSVALVSGLAAKRIGVAANRFLLVSNQKAGLRQSYVEEGKLRFSRLGRAEGDDPRQVAASCAAESARIQQYLVNLRVLPRDSGTLDVYVLAPRSDVPAYEAACASTPRLRFHVMELESACARAGLGHWAQGMLAERLFLYVLANVQPAQQYGEDALRRFYFLWRARLALIAAGGAIFGFCLVLSGLKLLDVYQVNQLADIDRQQERVATDQYSRLQATFPKTPTSRENLRALVRNYQVIQRQTAAIDDMLAAVSGALNGVPQIELERINWEISPTPQSAAARDAAKAPPPPPGPAGKAPAPEARYQVSEISGRINVPQASDYRGITQIVEQFVESLRAQRGLEVVSTRLPFDINAEKSLSGDIGTERSTDIPRFSVVVARRLPS